MSMSNVGRWQPRRWAGVNLHSTWKGLAASDIDCECRQLSPQVFAALRILNWIQCIHSECGCKLNMSCLLANTTENEENTRRAHTHSQTMARTKIGILHKPMRSTQPFVHPVFNSRDSILRTSVYMQLRCNETCSNVEHRPIRRCEKIGRHRGQTQADWLTESPFSMRHWWIHNSE